MSDTRKGLTQEELDWLEKKGEEEHTYLRLLRGDITLEQLRRNRIKTSVTHISELFVGQIKEYLDSLSCDDAEVAICHIFQTFNKSCEQLIEESKRRLEC